MEQNELFLDAHALSILYPDTFEAPSNEELQAIKVGDIVKVSTGEERFWVIVEQVHKSARTLMGKVDNDLLFTHSHGLQLGDEVVFGFQNVYDLQTS